RLEALEDRLAPAATLTVNSALDGNTRDAFLTLREALLLNNRTLSVAALTTAEQAQVSGNPTDSDTDTIAFAVGTGVQTIELTSALPAITEAVVLDGTTQPGFAGSPLIELNGVNAGSAPGLEITAGSCTVRGLVINRFEGSGILITDRSAEGNVVQGN